MQIPERQKYATIDDWIQQSQHDLYNNKEKQQNNLLLYHGLSKYTHKQTN